MAIGVLNDLENLRTGAKLSGNISGFPAGFADIMREIDAVESYRNIIRTSTDEADTARRLEEWRDSISEAASNGGKADVERFLGDNRFLEVMEKAAREDIAQRQDTISDYVKYLQGKDADNGVSQSVIDSNAAEYVAQAEKRWDEIHEAVTPPSASKVSEDAAAAARNTAETEEAGKSAWRKTFDGITGSTAWKVGAYVPKLYYKHTWSDVVDGLKDFGRLAKNAPHYGKRMLQWKFADHTVTKDFFAQVDTLKSTNAARLSILINPKNATGNNFVYKADDAKKATNNLTEAVEQTTDTLKTVSRESLNRAEDLKSVLTGASQDIADAAKRLEDAQVLTGKVSEFKQQATIFQGRAANILDRSGAPDAALDIKMLQSELTSRLSRETDATNKASLENALAKTEDLATKDLRSSDTFADASDIYNELSLAYVRRADEASSAIVKEADAAQSILNRHRSQIEQAGLPDDLIQTLNNTVDNLERNIDGINKSLDDIDAVPPPKDFKIHNADPADPRTRLIGGTVAARLASFEARPYMNAISEYSENAVNTATGITNSFDTGALISTFGSLDKTSSTFVDDLNKLSRALDEKAQGLNTQLLDNLGDTLAQSGDAAESVQKMDEAVLQYTRRTQTIDADMFGQSVEGSTAVNTILARSYNVGRIEGDVTPEMKKRFRELFESGELGMRLPGDVDINRVINYRPGETVMDITGSGQMYSKTAGQKFLEHAIMSQDPANLQVIRARATAMLENGDENRLWETLGWAMLTYARDPKTYKATGSRADSFYNEFLRTIEDVAKGRAGSGRWAGAFTDDVEKSTRFLVDAVADLGANAVRDRWAPVWNRTRHIRYSGDYSSERSYNPGRANVNKMSEEELVIHKQRLEEKRFAQWWDTGFGPEKRHGGWARTMTVMPKAILTNIPYASTHFSDWKTTGMTLSTQIKPLALQGATIYGISALLGSKDASAAPVQPTPAQPNAPVASNTGPASSSAPIATVWGQTQVASVNAGDLSKIQESSEENLEKITFRAIDSSSALSVIPGVSDPGELYIGNIFDKYRADLDSYKNYAETRLQSEIANASALGHSPEKVQELNDLLADLPSQFSEVETMLSKYETDLLAKARTAKTEIMDLDSRIQGNQDAGTAGIMLTTQIAKLNDFEQINTTVNNEVASFMGIFNGIRASNAAVQGPASFIIADQAAIDAVKAHVLNYAQSTASVDTDLDGDVTDVEKTAARLRAEGAINDALKNHTQNGVTMISRGELQTAQQVALDAVKASSDTEIDRVKQALDADGDGTITDQERQAFKDQEAARVAAQEEAARKAADTARKAAEAAAALKAAMDTNNDGTVSDAEKDAYNTRNEKFLKSIDSTLDIAQGSSGINADLKAYNVARTDLGEVLPAQLQEIIQHIRYDDPNKSPQQKAESIRIINNMKGALAQSHQDIANNFDEAKAIHIKVNGEDGNGGLVQELKDLKNAANPTQAQKDRIIQIGKDLDTLGKQAERIRAHAEKTHSSSLEALGRNKDYQYFNSLGGKKLDDLLLKVDGGKPGFMTHIFGAGGSGVVSQAGGWLGIAKNRLGAFGEWWGDVKRSADSKNEAFAYTGMELGFYGLLGWAAINKVQDWTGMPSWMKWTGIGVGMIALIGRSGGMMTDMGANRGHQVATAQNVAQSFKASDAEKQALASSTTSGNFNGKSGAVDATSSEAQNTSSSHLPTEGLNTDQIQIANATQDKLMRGSITSSDITDNTVIQSPDGSMPEQLASTASYGISSRGSGNGNHLDTSLINDTANFVSPDGDEYQLDPALFGKDGAARSATVTV